MAFCSICDSAGATDFFSKEGRKLLICRNCRHIRWQTLPTDADVTGYYRARYTAAHAQETIQEQAREYYRNHVCELASFINRSPNEACLLDYGCSVPVLAHEAVKLSFREVYGVDWADESKFYGRAWGVKVLSPPELASFPERSIDIVRFSHIIEHSIDPLALLRSVLPKMRPGGLIYITQPNFPVFRPATAPHELKDSVYPEHLHFFSALSLVEMACRLNLRITRFFTHQNEAAVVSMFHDILDIDYARERLAAYAAVGDPYFSEYANWPYYAGENSVLFAHVRA